MERTEDDVGVCGSNPTGESENCEEIKRRLLMHPEIQWYNLIGELIAWRRAEYADAEENGLRPDPEIFRKVMERLETDCAPHGAGGKPEET